MRKIALLFLIIGLLTSLFAVHAAVTTYPVSLTASSPTLQSCIPGDFAYQVISYTASDTGSHTFSKTNDTIPNGGYISLYLDGTFDSANDCANRLEYGTGPFAWALTSGTTYQIVASSYNPGEYGTYDLLVDSPAVDTDGDGVPDGSDQCPGHDDTADADSDGIPDGCDTFPNDNDNDGVDDSSDQCPWS